MADAAGAFDEHAEVLGLGKFVVGRVLFFLLLVVEPTEVDGAVTAEAIVTVVYALAAEYRANGTFVMNSKTAGQIRKLKDNDGRFLWSDGLAAGSDPSVPVPLGKDLEDGNRVVDVTQKGINLVLATKLIPSHPMPITGLGSFRSDSISHRFLCKDVIAAEFIRG